MNIHQAVELAVAQGKLMTREGVWWGGVTKIKPTDTSDCCIVMRIDGKNPRRGWQPRAEDLMADDWIVLDS